MSSTLQQFINQIQPLIRDRTNGTIESDDIQEAANRAIRSIVSDHGILATKKRTTLDIFPGVNEYAIPSGFAEMVAIYDRQTPIKMVRRTPSEFWLRLSTEDDTFAVDSLDGTKYLLINRKSAGSSQQVHAMESVTADGTWTADTSGSDATNLTLDQVTKKVGNGSINFDLDVSQSGNNFAAIYNSDLTAVDLEDYEDVGTMFAWVFIPDNTYVTGVTMRWGSDSSNYWSYEATTQFSGASFVNGWNYVGFPWGSATETSSPDSSAIDYLYFRVTYSASQTDDTDFRLDDITMKLPETYEVSYYSSKFVEDSDGALQDEFSATTDTTLWENQWDNIIFWMTLSDCYRIQDRQDLAQEAEVKAMLAIKKYKARNMSELKKESVIYW